MAIANNKQIYKILIIILAIATVLGVTQYQWILSGYFFNQGVMEALTADSNRLEKADCKKGDEVYITVDCEKAKAKERYEQVDKLYGEAIENYTKAIENYTKAINDDTKAIEDYNLARLYYKQGQAYYKQEQTQENKYQKALDDYKQAQKLDPEYSKSADFHNELGEIYSKQKDFQTAIYEYTQAIKLNQKEADFYNNRGFAYLRINKNDDALKDYKKAWELKIKQPVDNNCMKEFVNNARNADFCSQPRYADRLIFLRDYKAAIAYYTLFFDKFPSNMSVISVFKADKVIVNSPAWNKGIKAGDKNLSIDGTNTTNTSLKVGEHKTCSYYVPVQEFAKDYFNRGYARYRLGDKEGAIEDLNCVLILVDSYFDNRGKRDKANKEDKKLEDIYKQAQQWLNSWGAGMLIMGSGDAKVKFVLVKLHLGEMLL